MSEVTLVIFGDDELLDVVALAVVNGTASHKVFYRQNKFNSLISLQVRLCIGMTSTVPQFSDV